MHRFIRPFHVRAAPAGDGAEAVVHRLNTVMASVAGEPTRSMFHHPKTGVPVAPMPYEMPSLASAMTIAPKPGAMTLGENTLYDPYMAAVEEANKTQMYAGMPFTGKLRKAASSGR